MTYSENQMRAFYVANATTETIEGGVTNKGTISVTVDGTDKSMFFNYVNALGEITRSDIIPLNNISSITYKTADELTTSLKYAEVTINDNPIAGQDYILHIQMRQFMNFGDASTYGLFADVHATSGMSKSDFYAKMIKSLNKNVVKVGLTDTFKIFGEVSGSWVEASSILSTDTITKIAIAEVEQPWHLGTMAVEPVNFLVYCGKITSGGEEINWGEVVYNYTESTDTALGGVLPNSKKIADMEFFYHKEIGDKYGNMGYPNVIDTKLVADGSDVVGYNVLNIHYAYQGSCEDIQKSEKDITIAFSSTASESGLIGTIETNTGITIIPVENEDEDGETH